MYVEWRQQLRGGMKRLQEAGISRYQRARLFRICRPMVIPGLFQTAEYASALMTEVIEFMDIPNDLDTAIAAHMERQQVLYRGDRRFLTVLEEQAIRTPAGSADTMAGQDERIVMVETFSAALTITQPREIAIYAKAFTRLQQSAVFGPEARRLISNALHDLEHH